MLEVVAEVTPMSKLKLNSDAEADIVGGEDRSRTVSSVG